jgi:hypothetical protein
MIIQGGFNYGVDIPTITTTPYIVPTVPSQFYLINGGATTITITLPAPAAYVGAVINFRRGDNTNNITFDASGTVMVPYNYVTPQSTVILTYTSAGPPVVGQCSTTFISNGTYWYQMQTV